MEVARTAKRKATFFCEAKRPKEALAAHLKSTFAKGD